jgi:hypothetical protein
MKRSLILMLTLIASAAFAADPDVTSLYEVRTDGTSTALKGRREGEGRHRHQGEERRTRL